MWTESHLKQVIFEEIFSSTCSGGSSLLRWFSYLLHQLELPFYWLLLLFC